MPMPKGYVPMPMPMPMPNKPKVEEKPVAPKVVKEDTSKLSMEEVMQRM